MEFTVGDRVYHVDEKFYGTIIKCYKHHETALIECEPPYNSDFKDETERKNAGLKNGYKAAIKYLRLAPLPSKDDASYYDAITNPL